MPLTPDGRQSRASSPDLAASLVLLRAAYLRDKFQAQVLAKLGVTEVEYDAMTCPRYDIPLSLRRMARHTVTQLRDFSTRIPPYSADDYLAALEGMVAKKWLEIAPDPARETAKLEAEGLPRAPYIVPPAGTVAFTRRGFFLHRKILAELLGRSWLRNADLLQFTDPGECESYFFARTARDCSKQVEEARTERDLVNVNGPIKIIDVSDPAPCKFRLSRFQVVQHGFRVTVRYRKLRSRAFSIPGVNARGSFAGYDPIRIYGHVDDRHFSFSDEQHFESGQPGPDAYFLWHLEINGAKREVERPDLMLSDDAGPVPKVPAWGSPELTLRESDTSPRRTRPLSVRNAQKIATECILYYHAYRSNQK